MLLTVSVLYAEVGVSFQVSHLVFRVIRDVLVESVMKPHGLIDADPAIQLSLIVSTKKSCRLAEAKGPDVDKKRKTITWGLWLPYEEIQKHADQRAALVTAVFEAAGQVFEKYGVPASEVSSHTQSVIMRVSGADYAFVES